MSPGTFCRSVTNEDATTEGFGFTAPASIARKDTATRNSKFLFRMQSHKEFDDHLLQVRRPEFASPSQRGPDQRPDLRPDQRSSKSLVTTSVALVPSSFLLLVVRHLLLVAMPGAPSSVLAPRIYIYIHIYASLSSCPLSIGHSKYSTMGLLFTFKYSFGHGFAFGRPDVCPPSTIAGPPSRGILFGPHGMGVESRKTKTM